MGVSLIIWGDVDYPRLLGDLRPINVAPPLLYVRGSLGKFDEWAVAIVGTRKATPYGLQVTHQFARDLAYNRLTIVSGLAHGIDTEAHRAALEAGGRTIAVLPNGMDIIFPAENRRLAEQIARHGALITAFPLGTPPKGRNFPPRNVVLSGLARGVLVTEAGLKSGAMGTASGALDQGREVFAVPGNITAQNSAGVNQLIRDGAHVAMEAQDVLEVLKLERVAQYAEAQAALPEIGGDEQAVLRLLSAEPMHIDEITRQCNLPVGRISSALTLLELKGLVRQVTQSTYIRT
jgi:DNA processing protein